VFNENYVKGENNSQRVLL